MAVDPEIKTADAAPGKYTLGQSKTITDILANRTALKEAAFIVPHIQPHFKILDVGCGPGSITCDFAALVPDGSVIGVDVSPEAVKNALAKVQERKLTNVHIKEGDILEGLSLPEKEFDLIFCHQVLVHSLDAVQAIRNMIKYVKPGGLIASRESSRFEWYPFNALLNDVWDVWMLDALQHVGHKQPVSGTRQLHLWAEEAGIDRENIKNSQSGDVYVSKHEKTIWYNMLNSMMNGDVIVSHLLASGRSQKDLDKFHEEFDKWLEDENSWASWVSREIICRV